MNGGEVTMYVVEIYGPSYVVDGVKVDGYLYGSFEFDECDNAMSYAGHCVAVGLNVWIYREEN
jgi:hypothetical protein